MNSEANSSFNVFIWSTSKTINNSVWTHSHWSCNTDSEHDSKLRYCTLCSCLRYSASYYTNISINMWRHLQWHHEITVESSVDSVQVATLEQLEQLEWLYLNTKSSDQTEEINIQVFEKQLNQNTINKTLIFLIIVQNLFFWMIEWSEFHTFCQILNSKSDHFIIMTHSQIEQKIRKAFKTHKNTVWKKLQSALINIHLSVDIWTSLNKHLLLAVTDDFVKCTEEKCMKTFLALYKIKNHSEEN